MGVARKVGNINSSVIGVSTSLKNILGVIDAWWRDRSFGHSRSIFDLVRRVQNETDEISFRRQILGDRMGRSRDPIGF
jgi:hypothetical protein